MYYVYGDYGYSSETLLEAFPSLSQAIRFVKGYIRSDFGGHSVIEVATFVDEEYVTHYAVNSEDYD